MKLRWWLMIVWASTILLCTTSQSPLSPSPAAVNENLFLCQPTSEISSATVYIPNIPESYFSAEQLQQKDFREFQSSTVDTFVFSVPDESEQRRNCSGSVVAIEYCYRVMNRELLQQSEQDVFTFYSLIFAGRGRGLGWNFIINDSYMIQTTPSRKCAGSYCCDRTTLNTQFPSTNYAFGVNVTASGVVRQLRLNTPAFKTERSHQNCRKSFSMITCTQLNGPILLFKLIIEGNTSRCTLNTTASLNSESSLPTTTSTQEATSYYAKIVGSTMGVVTVLVLLTTLIVLIVILYKRKNKQQAESEGDNAIPKDANISLNSNECYAVGNTATHAVTDIPLEVNACYSMNNMSIHANECYTTDTPLEVNTHHANNNNESHGADIPLEVNTCYSTNMSIQANECYSTAATGGDAMYAEIEGPEQQISEDYDYI